MSTPVRAGERDLRALAAIVSEERADLPAGPGVSPSLLADLTGQIRCDALSLDGWDSRQQLCWFRQQIPSGGVAACEALDEVYWEHYWDCELCSYPARTGDLRSVIKVADFYSARQWHATGMYCDHDRPLGMEHSLMVGLPRALPHTAGSGRYVQLTLIRGPGEPDFSERDRAVLTLVAPHLDQAYLDAERRRHPVPRLTRRQTDLLGLLAAGCTNTQIARRLGISEGTVRTHLENLYARLQVSSRTAAVTRAFPEGASDRLSS
ncbi:MAG TPA: response regulator transcription factor [Streptosporangiaceae bacterium]